MTEIEKFVGAFTNGSHRNQHHYGHHDPCNKSAGFPCLFEIVEAKMVC